MGNALDLTGQKFGVFTALHPIILADDIIQLRDPKDQWWLCRCECGCNHESIMSASQLQSHYLVKRSSPSGPPRKYSKFILDGEYGVGYTTNGHEFFFDLDDYTLIKDHCWCYSKGYLQAMCRTPTGELECVSMHRLIMGLQAGDRRVVDHINGKPNDNRRNNLRIVTQSQNRKNSKLNKNNTSGASGVSWDKSKCRWRVDIICNGKKHYIGRFKSLEEATSARHKAEEKFYGEFRRAPEYQLNGTR